jgi:serpin B
MKLSVVIVCAALLICFLPVSGLDLSRFPDLQAKYPALDSKTTRTTFDEVKENFVNRSTGMEALIQKFHTGQDSVVSPALPEAEPEEYQPILGPVPTSSYSEFISKYLQNPGNHNSGSAGSLLDKYGTNKTVPAPQVPVITPSTSDAGMKVVEANNRFALDLYTVMAAENPGDNIFFSPWSISSALAVTYEGAEGTTEDEIRSVFHFPADESTMRTGYKEITDGINSGNSGFTLKNANALWAEETYAFLPSYLDTTDRYYSARVTNLDFMNSPEESRQTINRWVEDQTANRIRNLLPAGSILPETMLVITNAIYFKGTWATEFNEENTANEDFRVSPTKTVQVPMMKQTGAGSKFWYAETGSFQVLGMPYASQGGKELSMLVLLPTDGDLEGAEDSLDVWTLSELRQDLVYQQVKVWFPKFKLETDYQMADTLSEMGMPSAFNLGVADFSGMDGTKSLAISQVFHKAYVDVNEEGTEAAAATAVPMYRSMEITDDPVPVFRADHPFIFLIMDNESGNILFMGRVTNPGE